MTLSPTMFSDLEQQIELERTRDLGLVWKTLTHPRIWPHIIDDSSPPPEEFRPIDPDSVYYLKVSRADEFLGLFVLTFQTGVCWEVHTALLPQARGRAAAAAARAAQAHLWRDTPCRRIVTTVPIYNRLALKFAKAAGMRSYGYNRASIMRGGRLWDQELLGISRDTGGQSGEGN